MYNKIKTILIITPFIFLSSYTMKQVSVNTIPDRQKIPQGFPNEARFFISINDDNDLFAREIANKVVKIVRAKGYQIAQELSDADYYLSINAGVIEERTVVDSQMLIPGQTRSTNGTIDGVSYSEETRVSDEIVYVPQKHSCFRKTLLVSVYEVQNGESQRKVWQGSAFNYCDDELRSDIDFLLISVFKYFGQDTQRTKTLTLVGNNKDVAALRDETKQFFKPRKKRP